MSCSLSLCTLLILFSLVRCPVIPFVSSLSFNISSFDTNLSDILYQGVAKTVSKSVVLTEGFIPPKFQVGHMQYTKPIDIWDSVTGKQADFSTRFSFTIDIFNSTGHSDGMAFFLAPVGFIMPPNSAGQFLGLFNRTTCDSGLHNQIVFVEFDSYVNLENDPAMEHIGINRNSIASLVYAHWDAGSHNGSVTNVLVTYNSTSENLTVSWSFDGEPGFST
ncbi:hypothetical protein NL676_012461 [Syzygium grande]|nr:hypothetical protein NL676_012461 [Syzygium grande]